VLDGMHGGGLGEVANMGLQVPRRQPARTAVPAQIHGQDGAIGQGVLGEFANCSAWPVTPCTQTIGEPPPWPQL
jgi:hypothetical protein